MSCPHCGNGHYSNRAGCERCGYSTTTGAVRVAELPRVNNTSSPITAPILRGGNLLGQGRYRLVHPIPVSVGNGIVWLAIDLISSERGHVEIREVTLPSADISQQELLLRTLTTRMMQLGQHPSIPTTLGAFREHNKYYVVFQHIEGISLSSYLRQKGGTLPERTVAEFGRQLSEILFYFSRQQPQFVHGNITPDNILVRPDEQHIALVNLPLTDAETMRDRRQSNSNYYAPELARGSQGSPASDLFSVAAVMHHMLTDYNLPDRTTNFYPPVRRLNPHISRRMEEILAKELFLSVSQRYVRALDMQVDLIRLIATYPPQTQEHGETRPTPSVRQLDLTTSQLHELSRSRSLVTYGIVAIGLLLLLIGGLTPAIFAMLNSSSPHVTTIGNTTQQQQQAALERELLLEGQTFNAKGIGLSDGRFALDVYERSDTKLKQQAAQAWQKGDMGSAVNLLTQTVLADPTDAEAQIYNENIHILQSGSPSVTIVLGVAIDKGVVDQLAARAYMQGAFIAQREINKNNLLPNGLKLRIFIDSCGANHGDIATVAQFVANRILKTGNGDNIIGVVGWPFSSQTILAHDIIASAHLPMISPTSSSVQLSGSSPYFFRVNPPDDQQGKTLGALAVSQLHAKKILVLRDPTEAYSVSLANAFALSVQALGATTMANTFTTSQTSVTDYEKIVNGALKQNADLIFIAGFDVDGVRLAHAVGEVARNTFLYPQTAQLHVLGGDALATNLLLGQGKNADAQLAASYPQDMRRLIFSAFGHHDEWTFSGVPKDKQPPFFADWVTTFQSSSDPNLNAPAPENNAILTNDALRVLIHSVSTIKGTITGPQVCSALLALGHNNLPPYQGVSGRILFDTLGNPVNKALVVLSITSFKGANTITLTQIVGKFM